MKLYFLKMDFRLPRFRYFTIEGWTSNRPLPHHCHHHRMLDFRPSWIHKCPLLHWCSCSETRGELDTSRHSPPARPSNSLQHPKQLVTPKSVQEDDLWREISSIVGRLHHTCPTESEWNIAMLEGNKDQDIPKEGVLRQFGKDRLSYHCAAVQTIFCNRKSFTRLFLQ